MTGWCWNIGLLIPLQKMCLLFWNSGENFELKTFFFPDKNSSIQVFHKIIKDFFFFNSPGSLKLSNKCCLVRTYLGRCFASYPQYLSLKNLKISKYYQTS